MSSITTAFTSKLSSTLNDQKKSISSFMNIIATSILNQISSRNFFKCPTYGHKEYGLCFLLGPAAVLSLITVLFSFGTIKTLAGICRNDEDAPAEAPFGRRKQTWLFVFRKASLAIGYSLISFLCWIVLTLLTTETYSCIKIGPMPKAKTEIASYLAMKEKATTQSRIAGIILLVACLSNAMVMHFIVKCCLADPAKKLLASMRRYDELEALAANKAFTAHMEAVATFNGIKIAHEALGAKHCQLHCHENDKCTLDSLSDMTTERIENVRKCLARRYPRLDNEANTTLPYLNDNETWELQH